MVGKYGFQALVDWPCYRLRRLGLVGVRQDLVDQSVLFRLDCTEISIATSILGNHVYRLTRVAGQDVIQDIPRFQNLFGLDLDVRNLPADFTERLMNHHLGVR